MYKFHITGYTGNCKNDYQYNGNETVDATVYADTLDDAIDKIYYALKMHVSTQYRKVSIEEVEEW